MESGIRQYEAENKTGKPGAGHPADGQKPVLPAAPHHDDLRGGRTFAGLFGDEICTIVGTALDNATERRDRAQAERIIRQRDLAVSAMEAALKENRIVPMFKALAAIKESRRRNERRKHYRQVR